MKKILVFVLMLSTVISYGQYFKVGVVFKDGTKKEGYAKVPDGNQKKVSFKYSDEGDVITLKSDDIFTLEFKLEDGRFYKLERSKVKMLGMKKSGEIVSKINKKEGWYFLSQENSKLNYYMAGQKYKIDKKGYFKIKSSGQTGFTAIGYYLKRPSESEVTYITATKSGVQVFHEKMFRNTLSTYLKDNEELADRIKNKEFKSKQLLDVYNIYISE